MNWTKQDNDFATVQGWNIFEIDCNGTFELQKEDEQHIFKSDREAFDYVFNNMLNGCKTSLKAIQITLQVSKG